jgi:hypothetical protein
VSYRSSPSFARGEDRDSKNFLTFSSPQSIIEYYRKGANAVDEDYAVFQPEELAYISRILRGAFEISTADGRDDELLGDFIQALDD